jgi:hypothetical protein
MGVAEDILRLEQELRELITKYDQYFYGIEKREPLRLLDSVDRLAKRYQNVSIPNAMQRFKYDQLVSSLNVHRQKWIRITRQIEEGKYVREAFKASQPKTEQPPSTPAPVAAPSFDQQVDRIYNDYCNARAACNLSVDGISRDKIAQVIQDKTPAIKNKYHCQEVEFFVVVENGKPSLKARQKTP